MCPSAHLRDDASLRPDLCSPRGACKVEASMLFSSVFPSGNKENPPNSPRVKNWVSRGGVSIVTLSRLHLAL